MKTKILLAITACVMTITYSQAQNVSFKDNIVSKWSFEDEIKDDITGATGTIEGDGGTSYTADGVTGKGLDFTGAAANSIVIVEDDGTTLNPINFTNESFTVSMWANVDPSYGLPDDNLEQTLFMKGSNSAEDADETGAIAPNANGQRYTIHTKQGQVRFALDDNDVKTQLNVEVADVEGGYPLNEWVHIVGMRNVEIGEVVLFVNGKYAGSMADGTGPIDVAGQRLLFGNFTNRANPSQGPIDEVLIINKALSDAEVEELYNSYKSSSVFSNRAIENITIAPNPVSSELSIYNANKLSKVEVYNLSGMLVKTITNQNDATISSNVEELPAGTYIVKGYSQDNVLTSGSFIKN